MQRRNFLAMIVGAALAPLALSGEAVALPVAAGQLGKSADGTLIEPARGSKHGSGGGHGRGGRGRRGNRGLHRGWNRGRHRGWYKRRRRY